MNNKEIQLIRNSWNEVIKMADVAGPLFYKRLFEIAPEVEPLFPTGDRTPQYKKLFKMLSYVVEKLDSLDEILNVVSNLAKQHLAYGVKEDHYRYVGEALLWTLERGLGENWTPNTKDAWIKCYGLLSEAMIHASKEQVA